MTPMMTIKDLIKILKEHDQNRIVLVEGYEYGKQLCKEKYIHTGVFDLPSEKILKEEDWDERTGDGGFITNAENGTIPYILIGRHETNDY